MIYYYEEAVMKKILISGQGSPNQDQSIVAFQLIHALYCFKLLNDDAHVTGGRSEAARMAARALTCMFLKKMHVSA